MTSRNGAGSSAPVAARWAGSPSASSKSTTAPGRSAGTRCSKTVSGSSTCMSTDREWTRSKHADPNDIVMRSPSTTVTLGRCREVGEQARVAVDGGHRPTCRPRRPPATGPSEPAPAPSSAQCHPGAHAQPLELPDGGGVVQRLQGPEARRFLGVGVAQRVPARGSGQCRPQPSAEFDLAVLAQLVQGVAGAHEAHRPRPRAHHEDWVVTP